MKKWKSKKALERELRIARADLDIERLKRVDASREEKVLKLLVRLEPALTEKYSLGTDDWGRSSWDIARMEQALHFREWESSAKKYADAVVKNDHPRRPSPRREPSQPRPHQKVRRLVSGPGR